MAFSTGNPGSVTTGAATILGRPEARESQSWIPWGECDPLFAAVVFAVEEAVLNVLVANEDMVGQDDHRVPALPHERVCELISAHRISLA